MSHSIMTTTHVREVKMNEYITENTDKYFTKSKNIVNCYGESIVKYAVFMRREVRFACTEAIKFLQEHCPEVEIFTYFDEGDYVPPSEKMFTFKGPMSKLVELETQVLQRVGFPCVSAYNAYEMTFALKYAKFIDMAARHTTGPEMHKLCAYGASVGSKVARNQGAYGFIGSSTDITAPYYGAEKGMGTMPHAIVGYAMSKTCRMSTLDSVQMYKDANQGDKVLVALVDYFGSEINDSLEIADWFEKSGLEKQGYSLGIRLDTHGGRYLEGLDGYESRRIIQTEVSPSILSEFESKSKEEGYLIGPGVSAAAIMHVRRELDKYGYKNVFIVASSGFNNDKCRVMSRVNAPIDMVGTGSYLPTKINETYATADIIEYDGIKSVKLGREWLLDRSA